MFSPGAALGYILVVGLVNYVNIKCRYVIVGILMSKNFQFMKINNFNINPDHVTTFLLILSICATPMRSAMVTLNLVIHFSPMLFEFKQLI